MNGVREHIDPSDMISTEFETVSTEDTSPNLDNQKEWWLRLHERDPKTRKAHRAATKANVDPNESLSYSRCGSSCGSRDSSVSTLATADSYWVDEWQHHLHANKPPSRTSSNSRSKRGADVFDRLYQKSLANQQAGKEKRERIAKSREKKHRPRRTITPGYAAEMYNRLHKESMNKFFWED